MDHVVAPCNSVGVLALYAQVREVVVPCLEALLPRSENQKVLVSYCELVYEFKTTKSGLFDVILINKWSLNILQN